MAKIRSGFMVGLTVGLAVAAAVVAVSATAQGASEIRAINLPDRTANLFSDEVMVGDTLYLSGRLGLVGGSHRQRPPKSADRSR